MIPPDQLREDVRRKRLSFMIVRRFPVLEDFAFLDEAGAKANMMCLYGGSPVGICCKAHTPNVHWKTTRMLSAIRTSGVVNEASRLGR
jgi:hypothetical protein